MKETNRYLTEKLFEKCWHEIGANPDGTTLGKCSKCGELFHAIHFADWNADVFNPDFFTWNGFGKLWEKCKEQEWWKLFLLKLIYAPSCHDYLEPIDYDGLLPESLIDPLTFPTRVREFMEGRE